MARIKKAPPKKNPELFENLQIFGSSEAEAKEQASVLSTTVKTEISPAEAVGKPKDFRTIHQGVSTNALTKARAVPGENMRVDRISGEATITIGNLTLRIPKYTELFQDLKTSTHQLVDTLVIELTETGARNPTVILTVAEYMKQRGLRDRKEAKKQLTADLAILTGYALTWDETRGKETLPYAGVAVTDHWVWADKQKTAVAFTFGYTFFQILKGYPVMPYPALLQRINAKRNPHSYYMGRKIAEHKNMNYGKKNEDLIAVKTLLESSPYFPSYDEVIRTDRHLDQRIISPFERDLNALDDILTWEYCHSMGKPLTDEELQTMSYRDFEELLVKITWRNYPEQIQEAKLERRAEAIEKAIAEKATTPKRKRASKKKKPAPETSEG